MRARRWWARATGPSTWKPWPSGPRWRRREAITSASRCWAGAPWNSTMPAMPHNYLASLGFGDRYGFATKQVHAATAFLALQDSLRRPTPRDQTGVDLVDGGHLIGKASMPIHRVVIHAHAAALLPEQGAKFLAISKADPSLARDVVGQGHALPQPGS